MATEIPSDNSEKKELVKTETPVPQTKRRLLFVVHRYAPFPGGSENYVKDMAENAHRRGHEVAVFAGEHMGTYNGVFVTSDPSILRDAWDLIIVHGGDVGVQNYVLQQADKLGGPVLYLLILPSNSAACVTGLHKARFLGCSTYADRRHVESWNLKDKMVKVRHGINIYGSIGQKGFRETYGIKTPYMFLSSGGYWPNKGFAELVDTFNSINRDDVTLVLTGYDNRHQLMPQETEFVKPFLFERRGDMLSALRAADLYILNSTSEGFGLVLLEAMLNGTEWAARFIAGAEVLRDFGKTYTQQYELEAFMRDFSGPDESHLEIAQNYVISNHQISNTVDDILRVLA